MQGRLIESERAKQLDMIRDLLRTTPMSRAERWEIGRIIRNETPRRALGKPMKCPHALEQRVRVKHGTYCKECNKETVAKKRVCVCGHQRVGHQGGCVECGCPSFVDRIVAGKAERKRKREEAI